MDTWEYVTVKAHSNDLATLVQTLNNAGARGWEVITMTNNDATIGMNSLVAVIRRQIVPFERPQDASPGWKADPSGRHDEREWDGEWWTLRARTGSNEVRDPPTQLTPANRPQ